MLFQVPLAVDDYHSSQKKRLEEEKYSTQSKETKLIYILPYTKQLNHNLERLPLVRHESNCNMRSICSQINLEHTRIVYLVVIKVLNGLQNILQKQIFSKKWAFS